MMREEYKDGLRLLLLAALSGWWPAPTSPTCWWRRVEKFDEVASIGRYDAEITVEGIFLDLMVGPAG